MKKFPLITEYVGYLNKKDITNCDPRALVAPSQNVIINDAEKVEIRKGYSLFTDADTSGVGINGSFDWTTNTNVERHLVVTDDGKIKFLNGTSYIDLVTGMDAGTKVEFATWWDEDQQIDLLLFIKQDDTINMWSGAVGVYDTSTTNTIVLETDTSVAEERFLSTGTTTLILDGTEYTYTGISGKTFTGVTPDPTLGGHTTGAVIHQGVRVSSNTPYVNAKNSAIGVIDNYVCVGSQFSHMFYMSSADDYTDFTPTNPRVASDPVVLKIDSTITAFAVSGDGVMYISGSKDDWYSLSFTTSADLLNESVSINRLKSGPGQGALTQSSVGNIKNAILYINNELAVDQLGNVENINTPQSKPLSDSISNEFKDADYTIDPHIKYFRNKTYIAIPSDNKVLIYDHEKGYWYPPHILPVSRLAIIDGELCGHSKDNVETYKLYDGTSDAGQPFTARAAFAYRNFGRPDWKKSFNQYFVEGYMSTNTTLTCGIKYDFGGMNGIQEYSLSGIDSKIMLQTISDGSLGKNPIGSNPIGSITDSVDDLPKFRAIIPTIKKDFYEMQTVFETQAADYQWQILRHGPNVNESTADGVEIKS